MTDEAAEPTAAWVRQHRAAYPYAFDPGGRLGAWFDVRAIPHAVLVDPEGTVVWKGHPARLDERVLQAALRYALAEPISGWPRETRELQLLLRRGAYARALAEATRLGEPYKGIVAERIRSRVAAVEQAHENGDYLGATRLGSRVVDELAGLREASEVKRLVDAMRRDRDVQRIIAGQERVLACSGQIARLRLRSDAIKLASQLEELRREFDGTIVAAQARGCLDDLERRLQAR